MYRCCQFNAILGALWGCLNYMRMALDQCWVTLASLWDYGGYLGLFGHFRSLWDRCGTSRGTVVNLNENPGVRKGHGTGSRGARDAPRGHQ